MLMGVRTRTPVTITLGDTTVLPCAALVIGALTRGCIEVGLVEIGVVGKALPRTKRTA